MTTSFAHCVVMTVVDAPFNTHFANLEKQSFVRGSEVASELLRFGIAPRRATPPLGAPWRPASYRTWRASSGRLTDQPSNTPNRSADASEMFTLVSSVLTCIAVIIREVGRSGPGRGGDAAFYVVLLFGFLGMSALGRLSGPLLSRPGVQAATLALMATPVALYSLTDRLTLARQSIGGASLVWNCLVVMAVLVICGVIKVRLERQQRTPFQA